MPGSYGDIPGNISMAAGQTIRRNLADTNSPDNGFEAVDLPTIVARAFSAPTHSIVTGTGATGFQVSSTRDATVSYNIATSTTATIGGASSVILVLEMAPTNSATPTDWVEVGRFSNGQTISLAIVLQSVQTLTGNLSGIVPAGYYAKIRSITVGTASATYSSGQEVLL